MARNSKQRKTERKQLRQQFAQTQNKGQIPPSVATEPNLPDALSYLDGNNYQLIFEKYNHKECEMPHLDKKGAKALIQKLAAITRVNSRSIAGTSLIRDRLNNTGDYSSLFRGLEDDIDELYEVQYAGTGRIICHFINQYPHNEGTISNYCCIIAILKKHRRT